MNVFTEHRVTSADFDALALGLGGTSAVEALSAAQVSRRKLLVLGLLENLGARKAYGDAAALLRQACGLIDDADARSTASLSPGDRLLLHPYLEVWALDVLLGLTTDAADANSAVQRAAQMGYLVAGAAVIALEVGLEVEIDLLVPAGGLAVPTAGRFVVDAPERPFAARLTTSGGQLALLADGRLIRWEPVHRLCDGVTLEDTDPYRDTFGYRAQVRLGPSQSANWSRSHTAAKDVIRNEYPEYFCGMESGLKSITPLDTPSGGHEVSAAARQAYGAVGCMLPATPAGLALLLLHEFQHVKLGALIDLVPMCDPDDDTLYSAPWRPDRRPLGALLQGAYAHLAVTDFWRRRRHTASDPARAIERFGHWRAQTAQVIDILAVASGMNDHGRRFVTGMAAAIAPWVQEDLSVDRPLGSSIGPQMLPRPM